MTQSEIAEKVTNNAMLTAVSRIIMAVGVPVALAIGGWYLSTTSGAIADISKAEFALADRVTRIEAAQQNGTQFQADTKEALSKLQEKQLAILQQLAALNATLRPQK